MDKKTLTIRIVIFAVILVGLIILMRVVVGATATTGKYDTFAQCLEEKGVKFYGAFWCPHCQSQKRMFGGSAKHLPYVECSTADGKGQTQLCKDNNIESYPTWEFADGTRKTGELSFAQLSDMSGCSIIEPEPQPGTVEASSEESLIN